MAKTNAANMTETASGPNALSVELPIRVKTYDIDFAGHVNNIVYVRWLEDLRYQFLDVHMPLEILIEQGLVPVVVETKIQYRKAIVLADRDVTGRMWLSELGAATFYLAAEFLVVGELRCTATHRATFVKNATNRPARIPAMLREAYARVGAE